MSSQPAVYKHQDEILYCARCGISFVWTQEEQRALAASGPTPAPTHCPGCRHLLPPAGRERGLVKWYDARRQYGFLVRAGEPELYVHRTAIVGGRALRSGDLVEFAVATTDRGPAAADVTLVERAAAETA
jgi:CspA family cold shock protein